MNFVQVIDHPKRNAQIIWDSFHEAPYIAPSIIDVVSAKAEQRSIEFVDQLLDPGFRVYTRGQVFSVRAPRAQAAKTCRRKARSAPRAASAPPSGVRTPGAVDSVTSGSSDSDGPSLWKEAILERRVWGGPRPSAGV